MLESFAMLKKLHCPSCGANLTPPPRGTFQVTCAYCHTVSMVEQPGQKQKQAKSPKGQPQRYPTAVYKTPRWLYAIYILPFVGTLAGVGATFWSSLGNSNSSFGGGVQQWAGNRPPLLRDLNNDDILDAIGWVRRSKGTNFFSYVAAFDGSNGQHLWSTPDISSIEEEFKSIAGLAGDRLLIVDASANVQAFSLTDGSLVWQKNLGERGKHICEVNGEGIIVTADDQAYKVDLQNGSIHPSQEPPACADAWKPKDVVLFDYINSIGSSANLEIKTEGMTISTHMTSPANIDVLLGSKEPGTRIPMVAAVRGKELLWASQVPVGDPLKVIEGAPKVAAIFKNDLFIAYKLTKHDTGWRLTAMELSTGRRRWDVEVPNSGKGSDVNIILPSPTGIWIPHWTWLENFDLETGRHQFTIGKWF